MDEAERLLKAYSDALPWMADPKTGRDTRDLFYRIRASVLAAMRKAGGVPQWQTIDSAPKDGKSILTVGVDSQSVNETRWLSPGPFFRAANAAFHKPDGWYWSGWDGPVGPVTPTHWLPMPTFAAAPQPPALDRDAVIEACAKAVEMYDCTISRVYIRGAAAAIRAMKSKGIT